MTRPSGRASTRGIATDFFSAVLVEETTCRQDTRSVEAENMPERAEEHYHEGRSCWPPSTIGIIEN
jgi:hypothetical protein